MEQIKKEIALALSDGGYRSTLFALGSLWRLNEFGLLPRINRITSVSGGSILSAFLAMKWSSLRFNTNTLVADNFKEIITDPIQRFCSVTIDTWAFIGGLLSVRKTVGDKVVAASSAFSPFFFSPVVIKAGSVNCFASMTLWGHKQIRPLGGGISKISERRADGL